MKYKIIGAILLVGVSFGLQLEAQELLEKSEAVSIALKNNFDIRSAKNNVEIARNNTDIKNTGYLPTATGAASGTFSNTNSKQIGNDGNERVVNGISTTRLSSNVGINYTLFDGWGRAYNYKILQQTYNLSELQSRQVIENTLINLFNSYYEVARLTQNVDNQKTTLNDSRNRLLRAKYSYEYGQNTQLDVLNAEVDYNTDSISYLTNVQLLENEKRNLNLLMGREVNTLFQVDTTLQYLEGLTYASLAEDAARNNVQLLQNQINIQNAEYNIKVINAVTIPKIGLNAGYNWSHNDLGPTGFVAQQTQMGPSVGASLSWNIFDGGSTNIRRQNGKITLQNQKIILEQAKMELDRNLANAWNLYQTSLFVLKAEQKNMETNQRNYDRTVEQYALGQITSIVFRQAQINLLNAQLNYNQAKYSAKVAELGLLQLSGNLLNSTF